MADRLYYPQEVNFESDFKIRAFIKSHGLVGIGFLTCLKVVLRRQPDYRFDLSKKFSRHMLSEMTFTTLEQLDLFINDLVNEFEICGFEGDFLHCFELTEAMRPLDEKRRKMSERGKKGAAVTNRKGQNFGTSDKECSAQAHEEGGTSDQLEQQEEKRKEKKRKEKVKESTNDASHPNHSAPTDNDKLNTIQAEKYSPEQKEAYDAFIKWIYKHAPNVAKMKEPFTIKQFILLKQNYDVAKVTHILESMHNHTGLLKKYNSAYLTLQNWIRRDEERATTPVYRSRGVVI